MGNEVPPVESGSAVEVENMDLSLPASKVTVKETKTQDGVVPLPEAELVVSAGRGMKGPENWGIIESLDSNYLAPSYGHAASLGRNESDIKRLEILNNSTPSLTIQKYVRRSKSFFYSQGKRIKTLDAFEQMSMLALEKKKSKAPTYWLGLLENLTEDKINSVITKVPDELMSEITKKFTLRLILANRDNLLELKNKFYD